ncbi:MAG: SPOR domain-containing protein [Candidatus Atribacteria bacterium]|nr:SPOR domain-containing protein [Candidatus Atribacteria bacterium]
MKSFFQKRDPVELVILLLGCFLVVMLAFFMARGDFDAYTQLLLHAGSGENGNIRPVTGRDMRGKVTASQPTVPVSRNEVLLSTGQPARETSPEQPAVVKKLKPPVGVPTPFPRETPKKPVLVSPKGGYFVQAGAFSKSVNAEKVSSSLKNMGHQATVEKSSGLFKVKIYGFPSMQEALLVAKKLKTQGIEAYAGQ